MEDQPPSPNNTRDIERANPITEVEDEDHHQYFDGRQIPKLVQTEQLKERDGEDYFTPKIVSFGPYYHGLPQLGTSQKVKHEVLTMLVSSSGKDERFFYCQIFKVIDQIRDCYVGVSRAEYDDGALAEMMLLDASFAIYIMSMMLTQDVTKYIYLRKKLGLNAVLFVSRDMNLLENQIPFWVIMQTRITRILGEDEWQPLHILDAAYQLLVQELDNAEPVQPVIKCQWCRWMNREENQNLDNRQFRSVVDLKAKGIHFKPSSQCLNDIDFKSYTFYGQLQLPVCLFNEKSSLMFTHLIAFELQTESFESSFIVTSYISFLKSIILKSEDVRELREKKILLSVYDSDEQVVKVIKEIYTFGYFAEFEDVKMRIEEHCSSRAKTWIAELIHTYFCNPWTSIALLAAAALLILTFLQTYYTMNPKC